MSQTDTQGHHAGRAAAPPAVSVVIPAYNASAYIGEALDSVFSQSFADYEVIVVNDGSPDTEELERVLAPYRERLVYLRQENSGPGGARNAAIMIARGEYVAFLDSDDLWMPDYLSEQVNSLRRDPSVSIVCADAVLFGDSPIAGKTFMELWPSSEPVTFAKLLDMECAVLTMCVVASRRALIDAGLFDPRFIRSEDYDLWLRLAHGGGRFAYQHKVLARHRVHGASLSADAERLFESQIEVYRKLLVALPLSPEERRLVEGRSERSSADLALLQGKQRIMAGQYGQAAEALRRAYDYYRHPKLKLALLGLRFAPGLIRHLQSLRRRSPTRGLTAAM